MNPYLVFDYPTLNVLNNVTASTCKSISYEPIWVKNGKCTDKHPQNFDLSKDKLYIVGVGNIDGIVFPETINSYDELPPEPNCEYNSLELLNSVYKLGFFYDTHNLDNQIECTIDWCAKYGFPFFGNNGFEGGDITTCYKDTGKIGFNFLVFKKNVQTLTHTIAISHQNESFFTNILNTAMLQMRPQYKFKENKLICEMGFNTLISLAFFQLACAYMTPSGSNIKCCKQCNIKFISDNPLKEYCEKHSPQSHYAQKQRMKAKQNKAPGTS